MTTKIPSVSQISSRIIRVLGMNPGPMTLQGTNTYILGTGNRRLLIDTGESNNSEYINNLSQVLKKESITLEHIVLTHWHMDHVGGLKDIYEHIKPDCKNIWKFKRSPDDQETYGAGENDFIPPDQTLQYLTDGQKLEVEGATLRIIHTPGHSTDHIVLKLEEENAIFSGDCILGESTTVFSDLISYLKSLRLIKSLNPTVIYPAHGPIVQDPIQTINYYIKHREEREKAIIKILEENIGNPKSVGDIVKLMYGDNLQYVFEAAKYVVSKTLIKLGIEEIAIKDEQGKWQLLVNSKL